MGQHFKLISSETVELTEDLAAEFSSMPSSTTERDLKPKRIDYLKDAVLGGAAITFSWARAKVAETGDTYRVNGHHSSTMLASLDGQFPDGLKAHIDNFEVDDVLSLALLHRQFETNGHSWAVVRSIDDARAELARLEDAVGAAGQVIGDEHAIALDANAPSASACMKRAPSIVVAG